MPDKRTHHQPESKAQKRVQRAYDLGLMTTAIALETSKGELAIAMALGLVLLSIALLVNIASQFLRHYFKKAALDV